MENLSDKLTMKIDDLALSWGMSGGVAVYSNGKFDYLKSHGEISDGLAIENSTLYSLSCCSQLFLMLAFGKLIEQKKLDLNDTIGKYLPEYVNGDKITVAQLARHESGIPDYAYEYMAPQIEASEEFKKLSDKERFVCMKTVHNRNISFAEILSLIGSDLNFQASSRKDDFSCSEVRFAKEIIERITGSSVLDFYYENIFAPLGIEKNAVYGKSPLTSYCIFNQNQLIPAEESQIYEKPLCVCLDNMALILKALAERKLFSNKIQKQLFSLNEAGNGIFCHKANGSMAFEGEYLGFEMKMFVNEAENAGYLHLTNENQILVYRGDEWKFFRRELRYAVEDAFAYPKNPKLDPYCEKNCTAAMRIELKDFQKKFVSDVKTTLAYAYGRKHTKVFILSDCGRVIGLVQLLINRKAGIFDIETIIIDKRFQGRGYGKILLTKTIEYLKSLGASSLEIGVHSENLPAVNLYESLGFKTAAVYENSKKMKLKI